jgi:transcriptional regulator
VFVFPRFGSGHPGQAVRLVRRHPFALVVSSVSGKPTATHTPVLVENPVEESFVGRTLLGHIARVNPQWWDWSDSPEVLVVFSGPDGYVSPTVYRTDPAVPTWDYAAVHLTGTIELITDRDATLDVIERTVSTMESTREPRWTPTPASRARFDELIGGVVAFRVHVTGEQSLFKLSQDIPDDRRARVVADVNPALARLMEER